jgi:hypothetical protein
VTSSTQRRSFSPSPRDRRSTLPPGVVRRLGRLPGDSHRGVDVHSIRRARRARGLRLSEVSSDEENSSGSSEEGSGGDDEGDGSGGGGIDDGDNNDKGGGGGGGRGGDDGKGGSSSSKASGKAPLV